jgi:hypothetical protein
METICQNMLWKQYVRTCYGNNMSEHGMAYVLTSLFKDRYFNIINLKSFFEHHRFNIIILKLLF